MVLPFPRYCCMRKEDSNMGFGFSLIASINETGQYVEEVKPNSLADKAGLQSRDLVIEVNGRNILSLSHPEVVDFIKQQGNEVCLLVLDDEARIFYEDQSIVVNSNMPEVRRICSWDMPSNSADESPNISGLTLLDKPEGSSSSTAEVTPTSLEASGPSTEVPTVPSVLLSHKSEEEEKQKITPNSTPEENSPPIKEVTVTVEPSEPVNDAPVPPLGTRCNGDDFEEPREVEEPEKKEKLPEKVEEVKEQEPVSPAPVVPPAFSSKTPLQGRPAHTPRSTPSRKACMGSRATFGDKAKAFDEL